MAVPTIPESNDGGLKSIQDLYDMINGKTTTTGGGNQTTSGGTSTVTKSEGISKEGMDSMLQNILSGTQGLAAVSQGQRSAGGYGSSVNTMLTNDLLTRSAAQVAALNTTSTITTTTPQTTINKTPVTSTVGGATVKGGSRVAGTLGILQGLSKLSGANGLDVFKKIKDIMGNNSSSSSANGSAVLGTGENASTSNAVNGADLQSDQYVASNVASNAPSFNMVEDMLANFTPDNNTFSGDNSGSNSDFNMVTDMLADSSFDTSSYQSSGDTYDSYDFQEQPIFADGGLVSTKKSAPGYADGGEVQDNPTRRKSNILGTSQYSTLRQEVEAARASEANAANAPEITPSLNLVSKSPSSAITANSPGQVVSGGDSGTGGGNSDTTGNQTNADGSFGTISGGQIASALGLMGGLTGNPALGMMGAAVGIGSSSNPAKSALGAVANSMGLGATFSAVTNPSIANIADIAMSVANPALGLTNAALGVLGLGSLGQISQNAINMANPNQAISPAMQASINSANDTARDSLNAVANMSEDPMQGLMDATNAFGTTAESSGVGPGADANTDASSANAVNGADSQSDAATSAGNDSSSSGTDSSSNGANSGDGSEGGGGVGAADGGHIEGAGTGISDSINAKLSDGEFVLSADVVKAIGVDKLQALQDKYHVPAAVQRLKQFGKR